MKTRFPSLKPHFAEIRYLLWDNDGVLVNTEPFYYEAARRVLTDDNVVLTPELFTEHSLRRGQSVFDAARARGISATRINELRARRDALYARFTQTEDIFIQGVEETVAQLATQFKMAIVSSSLKENFYDIHARTGNLLSHFEFVLLNGDYPRAKPHPDPWLEAAKRFGAHPHQCLVIEDSPRGIVAAQAAQMTVAAVESHFFTEPDLRPFLHDSDHVIHHICDLPALLLAE